MTVALPAGKLRNLMILADETGRFKMMAIDQRTSLQRSLETILGRRARYEEIGRIKRAIIRALSPHATAVLTDSEYGYPQSVLELPGKVGLLLAIERSGYEPSGPEGRERRSAVLEGWSVEKARRAGANAIKMLLPYRPDASAATNDQQQALVRQVGAECARFELPFLLELVGYPLGEPSADSPAYARRKPQIVVESAREFSRPEYGLDLLKLEFPADLKYCSEFSRKRFDDTEREPVYDLSTVRAYCRTVDETAALPWVILSAGVDIAQFVVSVELAVEAGASGFLCGRAIWKGVVPMVADEAAMERYLAEQGTANFLKASAAAALARPWFAHRKYGGRGNLAVAGASPAWYRED